jgi:hypothetical protein
MPFLILIEGCTREQRTRLSYIKGLETQMNGKISDGDTDNPDHAFHPILMWLRKKIPDGFQENEHASRLIVSIGRR